MIDDDIAIEQMIRWLCKHQNHYTISTSNVDIRVFSACWRPNENVADLLGKGETLREALKAACDEVKAREATGKESE